MKKLFILLTITFSFFGGILWQNLQDQTVVAQTSLKSDDGKNVIFRSSGSALSTKKPDEAELFKIYTEDNPKSELRVIPEGKKLVITDMMFDARYANQDLVINLNQRIEDKNSLSYKKHNPLQQVSIKAGESKEIHFCTGYVIRSGNGIVAWTNAGLTTKQLVLVNFTGYLADDKTAK